MVPWKWVLILPWLLGAAAPKVVPCPGSPEDLCVQQQGRWVRLKTQPAPAPPPPPPSVECVEDEDQKVCGYHCLKNYGQMRCAGTPQGTCAQVEGKLTCWDPSPALVAWLGAKLPAPTCVSNYGLMACGYHCVEHDGHLGCAQTPMGQCAGNFGTVVCFDPALALLPLYQGQVPQAQCVEEFGKVACGYHCLAQYGEVGCATTPQGTCTTKAQHVRCFDAAVPVVDVPLLPAALGQVP